MNNKRWGLVAAVLALSLPILAAEDATKNLFTQKCSSCHGKDGKGNPGMAKVFKLDVSALDLTSKATAAKKDEELIAVTTKGHGKMPAYETKLKGEEIKALVAFIRTLSKPKS